jgi:hypothetical protein
MRVAAYRPTNPTLTRAFRTLASDLYDNNAVMLDRLGELFQNCHAAAIRACSCSDIFRISVGRIDSQYNGNLSWGRIDELILKNYNSIELLFLTRIQIDWRNLMTFHDAYYRSLLLKKGPLGKTLNVAQATSGLYTATDFGFHLIQNLGFIVCDSSPTSRFGFFQMTLLRQGDAGPRTLLLTI